MIEMPPKKMDKAGEEKRIVDLGWRDKTHDLNSVDYFSYERMVFDFIQNNSHVWATIMKVDAVLTGLMGDHLVLVYEMRAVGEKCQEWWDDALTEEEEDLICSIYKMYTGNGLQYKLASWWPWSNVWDHSSMNLGFWSPSTEIWFANWLEKIQNNKCPEPGELGEVATADETDKIICSM
ncbi:hypothetical protein M0805_008805 [Coniferiporia weirii]|nr:hypothetical protein M0805_008805 [Coniferiporia weirii]